MNSIHNHFKSLSELITSAKDNNLPYSGLLHHQFETMNEREKLSCRHLSTKAREVKNVRFYECETCKEIIDYETIA